MVAIFGWQIRLSPNPSSLAWRCRARTSSATLFPPARWVGSTKSGRLRTQSDWLQWGLTAFLSPVKPKTPRVSQLVWSSTSKTVFTTSSCWNHCCREWPCMSITLCPISRMWHGRNLSGFQPVPTKMSGPLQNCIHIFSRTYWVRIWIGDGTQLQQDQQVNFIHRFCLT